MDRATAGAVSSSPTTAMPPVLARSTATGPSRVAPSSATRSASARSERSPPAAGRTGCSDATGPSPTRIRQCGGERSQSRSRCASDASERVAARRHLVSEARSLVPVEPGEAITAVIELRAELRDPEPVLRPRLAARLDPRRHDEHEAEQHERCGGERPGGRPERCAHQQRNHGGQHGEARDAGPSGWRRELDGLGAAQQGRVGEFGGARATGPAVAAGSAPRGSRGSRGPTTARAGPRGRDVGGRAAAPRSPWPGWHRRRGPRPSRRPGPPAARGGWRRSGGAGPCRRRPVTVTGDGAAWSSTASGAGTSSMVDPERGP